MEGPFAILEAFIQLFQKMSRPTDRDCKIADSIACRRLRMHGFYFAAMQESESTVAGGGAADIDKRILRLTMLVFLRVHKSIRHQLEVSIFGGDKIFQDGSLILAQDPKMIIGTFMSRSNATNHLAQIVCL